MKNENPQKAIKALIVEDNHVNAELLLCYLQTLGHQGVHASTGRKALETLKNDNFDLVLMDCHMPDMDGFETTKAMRLFDPGIPICAVTAMDADQAKKKALAMGMNDFLCKPIRKAGLIKIIQRYTQSAPNTETCRS